MWPSDTIGRHKSGSTLAQVMACYLTAPSHYLNQCWLIICKVQWHPSESNFTRDTSAISVTEISLKITYLKFCSNFPGANELKSLPHLPGANELILHYLRVGYAYSAHGLNRFTSSLFTTSCLYTIFDCDYCACSRTSLIFRSHQRHPNGNDSCRFVSLLFHLRRLSTIFDLDIILFSIWCLNPFLLFDLRHFGGTDCFNFRWTGFWSPWRFKFWWTGAIFLKTGTFGNSFKIVTWETFLCFHPEISTHLNFHIDSYYDMIHRVMLRSLSKWQWESTASMSSKWLPSYLGLDKLKMLSTTDTHTYWTTSTTIKPLM